MKTIYGTFPDEIPETHIFMIKNLSKSDTVAQIPQFPLYAVTLNGQVWSVRPHSKKTDLPDIPRRLKTRRRYGIEIVNVVDDQGMPVTHSVAKLMLMAFISPIPFEDAKASFVDGDNTNLSLDNLEWISATERQRRTLIRYGGHFPVKAGNRHTKLDMTKAKAIKEMMANGESVKGIAELFGIKPNTVYAIKYGILWRDA